jgi:hypothetical protein
MAQRRNVLIVLAAIAVTGVMIFASVAISKAPTLPNGYGSLSYKVRAEVNQHRLLFEKVHNSHGRWLSTGVSTVGRGSSYEVLRPGRYKLKAYQRHCRHCLTLNPDPVGPKFNQCSHRFRIKEAKRTRGVLRIRRKRSCSIALGRPKLVPDS